MPVSRLRALMLSAFLIFGSCAVMAQAALAPPGDQGKTVYVPYPVAIQLDGNLEDWKGVPLNVVDRGPAPSKNPAEDGSFRFSLASDGTTLAILMLASDVNIVTGKHGADTWNEDSLEFYLNWGPNFAATKYGPTVAQLRVVPSDIGNADPAAVNVSGQNLKIAPFQGKVFKTADGWGFEGKVQLPESLKPAHGKDFGFQAHLNGASVKDRNVKLIWADADKADNSWQNPSLFGRALFFMVGSTDRPQPSGEAVAAATPAVVSPTTAVSVNQVGYFATGTKTAVYAKEGSQTYPWILSDAKTGSQVAQGTTGPGRADPVSGDTVHTIDFSSFQQTGTFVLTVDGAKSSPFRIANDVMAGLSRESLLYFYRNRSGMELKADVAGAAWARPAGHLSDAKVKVYEGYTYLVNGLGGWYDAGDFGKYVVNGGISVWTLLNAFERSPRGTEPAGVPTILEETRWEMNFLLGMQIPAGQPLAGMVFHKLHDRKWSGVPTNLPERVQAWERFAYEPSTAATLNLAAVAAQSARLWKDKDAAFAQQCLTAAKTAWKAALDHPALLAGNYPGEGGGNYDDTNVADDFYWAAAELAVTTGDKEYLDYVRSSPSFRSFPGQTRGAGSMNWGDTAALGTLSLVTAGKGLNSAELDTLKGQVVATADRYLKILGGEGYSVPMAVEGYVWGSNSGVLNNALVLASAYDLTGKAPYRDAVVHAMDYLLGMNSLRKSFVSGFGVDALAHPHHRVWGNDPDSGYPAPPPGAVAGGPNANLQDPDMQAANLDKRPIAKRYLDQIGSYATNEVAINWNAPLVWVARWLDQQYNPR